jgi:hypothetical protein
LARVENVGRIDDRQTIIDVIVRFGRALDDKDWTALTECLEPEIDADYSSFRGTPRARLSSQEFVNLRRVGLTGLVTEHLGNEYRVDIVGSTASCECEFTIRRWPVDSRDARFFHSCGTYRFSLSRQSQGWRISGITQVVIRSEGDPAIHGALRGKGR